MKQATTGKQRRQQRREELEKRAARQARWASTGAVRVTVGAVLLLIAAGASLLLAIQSLGSVPLPGCGLESACGRAVNSVWGKVPGLGWPTSYVGVAYFLGLLAAWFARSGLVPAALRWVVRLGAVASIVLVGAMVQGGYLCPYCFAVHVANFTFAALLEIGGRRVTEDAAPQPNPGLSLGVFAGGFVVASAVLAFAHFRHEGAIRASDERDLDASTKQIVDGAKAPDGEAPPPGPPFTGRYRLGPEEAPIRIVIISDYQCPDCRQIEQQARQVLANRDDVSFSAKHFPFCMDCNRLVDASRNLHPNACWAARAAETAGMIGGNDAFWKMHHWLFDRGGSFTDAEIPSGLVELGFDPAPFLSRMQSDEPLRLVLEDIEEAIGLGLRQTPMIFINGVELLGWRAPDALIKAVDQVAATNPPARTAAWDRPPNALEKHIRDWRESRVVSMPPDTSAWTLGDANAPGQVVIWGDYQEPYTAELDRRVRAVIGNAPGVHYAFRHYPIDQSCNGAASRTMHPNACRAAQAAEAAGRLGGADVYWRMHEWLFANIPTFSDATLRAAAAGMGLDPDALFIEMESPEVAAAINEDATAAKRLGLTGLPFFWVNGKKVPFWNLEGEPLPERIVEEAMRSGG